jgi:hypothetical protein
MEKLKDIFETRLIPPNKEWLDISTEDYFRLITDLSSMYKFIKMRFLPKLQRYISKEMDKN